jgi:ribonuclease HII
MERLKLTYSEPLKTLMLKSRHTSDLEVEFGIDEAGRGCLWGPLFAAAVCVPSEDIWSEEDRKAWAGVKDSKKLSPKRRAVAETFIKARTTYGIGRVEAAEIDKLGMTRSNQLAFERALGTFQAGRVIIDGVLSCPTLSSTIQQIVEPEADGTYLAVAAASILAKEARDRWVLEQCEVEPTLDERYGLKSSKGYGTAKHRAGVTTHGMHSQHRRLFLRKLLGIQCDVIGQCEIIDE